MHLLENQLYAKDEKCEFHVPTIFLLRNIINQESVIMKDTKMRAVTKFPGIHKFLLVLHSTQLQPHSQHS